jgi:hypothetical protein
MHTGGVLSVGAVDSPARCALCPAPARDIPIHQLGRGPQGGARRPHE